MAWELQWGKQRKFLEEAAKLGDTPPALLNKPKLSLWAAPYWTAYWDLDSSRQLGGTGAGPIPMSEIEAYLRLKNITDLDERGCYITMIRALDSVYLKHMAEQREAERNRRRGRRRK